MSYTNILTILYFFLVTVCIGISLVLSYFGYLTNFGRLSLPFTAAIGIGLFGSDILIRARRLAGRTLTGPILLFTLFAIFSGVSNFNFLYTNFMRADVTNAAVSSALRTFRSDITATRSTLESLDIVNFVAGQRLELQRELTRLNEQINDPLRPGCGERCEFHLAEIETILGKRLTDVARPNLGAPLSTVNAWYDRIRESVLSDFNQGVAANQFPQINALMTDIDLLLEQYNLPIQTSPAGATGLAILREISTASVDIERRARALTPESVPINHTYIDVTLGRLGEIVYSLENAFVARPNIGATIAAAILAVIVDVFPVLFALVAFSPDPSGRAPHQGGSAGRSGRGRVI